MVRDTTMFRQHTSGQQYHSFLPTEPLGSGNTCCPRCKAWIQGRPSGKCSDLQRRNSKKQNELTKTCKEGDDNCIYEFVNKTPTQKIRELKEKVRELEARLTTAGDDSFSSASQRQIDELQTRNDQLLVDNNQLVAENARLQQNMNDIELIDDFSDVFEEHTTDSTLSALLESTSSALLEQENEHLRQQLHVVRQKLSALLIDIGH